MRILRIEHLGFVVAAVCSLLTVIALCPTQAAADPFVIETIDSGVDIGWYTSIAVDVSGSAHISYTDFSAGDADLKYALRSGGTWLVQGVDLTGNNAGAHTSIALDYGGNPYISYYDNTSTDLKYARYTSGAWIIETADQSANRVGEFSSIAVDDNLVPHVSYHDFTSGDLKHAWRQGGTWFAEVVDDGGGGDAGLYTSIALSAEGEPRISYRHETAQSLRYAVKTGSTWTIEIADESGNVGAFTSLELDADEQPHISYFTSQANASLKYAYRTASDWSREVIESAPEIGRYSSLALDPFDRPHVAYEYVPGQGAKYASRQSTGWVSQVVEVGPNTGQFTSLAIDTGGRAHIAFRDQGNSRLRYAVQGLSVQSPTHGVTWSVGSLQSIAWSGLTMGPFEIYLSLDGGYSFQQLREQVTESPVMLRVPHTPTRFAQVKVRRASPYAVAFSDSFFTIDATITLAKFDAARDSDGAGTRLTWETQPGPEADIRYRVERAANGAAFLSIADALDRGEFVDPSPAASARYRLIAVNGLGEEYVLGETSVVGVLAADRDIIAFPSPASGPIEILYRVPVERDVDLAVYDVSGRRIRSLATGRMSVGVHSASWDRRDESRAEVATGVYFLRLRVGDGHEVTERVTVVR